MVGAGLESGCWMVWEMVEWRLVASVSELESGCIVAELALRVPKGGRMSVVGARARSPAPLLYKNPRLQSSCRSGMSGCGAPGPRRTRTSHFRLMVRQRTIW